MTVNLLSLFMYINEITNQNLHTLSYCAQANVYGNHCRQRKSQSLAFIVFEIYFVPLLYPAVEKISGSLSFLLAYGTSSCNHYQLKLIVNTNRLILAWSIKSKGEQSVNDLVLSEHTVISSR